MTVNPTAQTKLCPHCGAQIPLISNECLFCGKSLKDISIAAEQHDLKTCPDCGAPFPLVSNICTHCGHILHEQQTSDLNVKTLIKNIQESIDDLKSAPQPTFFEVLAYRKNFWFFLVSVLLLIMFLRYMYRYVNSGYTLLFLFLTSLVLWIVSLVLTSKNKKKDPPSKIADDKFFAALHRKEMFENQIFTLYGNNREAKEVLGQYAALTDSIKKERTSRQIKLAVIIFAFFGANMFLLFDTYSNKETFRLDTEKFSDAYALMDKKFTVRAADTMFSGEYVVAEGNAELSFDMKFDNYINSVFGDKIEFRLRLSNVKLKSTGKEYSLYQGSFLEIVLYDKKGQFVCSDFGRLVFRDDSYGDAVTYENAFYKNLKSGKGECFAEFVSSKTQKLTADKQTIEHLIQTAQNVKYFSVLLTEPIEY